MKLKEKRYNAILNTINFSSCNRGYKRYTEGTMKKESRIYENAQYMIKHIKKQRAKNYPNKPITYFNSIFSEYIACKIGKKIGLNIQETKLGYIVENNEIIPCVACKDFCSEIEMVFHFTQIREFVNDKIDNELSITNFYDILKIIEKQTLINSEILKEYFYDMFIFDAFIGNFDRNLDNFGLILNVTTKSCKISPIYDCGSSMHPKTPRNIMEKYAQNIGNINEIEYNAFHKPNSCFTDNNGEKINYYNFLVEKEFNHDEDIAEAILRIAPKLVEIQENGYIGKLLDSLSELMGEDRAKVLKIELEYKTQYMFKEMIKIANKVLNKEKEQKSSWIRNDRDDDWER